MAAGTVIYVRSGDAVFRIRNTIEKVTSRIAKVTCFIVIFRRNSQHYRKVASRIAKVTCFTVEIVVPAGPPPETTTLSRILPSRVLGPVI